MSHESKDNDSDSPAEPPEAPLDPPQDSKTAPTNTDRADPEDFDPSSATPPEPEDDDSETEHEDPDPSEEPPRIGSSTRLEIVKKTPSSRRVSLEKALTDSERALHDSDNLDRLLGNSHARPLIEGVSVVGEERQSSAGTIFSGWQSGVGRVRVCVSQWSPSQEERARISEHIRRLKDLEGRVLTPITRADMEHDAPSFVIADPSGLSLERVIARHGVPPPKWSALVMRHIADGLLAMHERGIMHLDVRPSSIHVDPTQGYPSFTNYGFFQMHGAMLRAVLRDETVGPFSQASILAPEQVDSHSVNLPSEQTDIYMFGATLYTLLAGTTPFTGGTTATILRKVIHEDPTPLRRIDPGIPEDMESLCVACLKKKPRERPQSFQAIIKVLDKLVGKSMPGSISPSRVTQIIAEYRVIRIRERRGTSTLYEVLPKKTTEPRLLELGPVPNADGDNDLQRERELIQRIEDHPHILKIHEVGMHEGRRFVVTDFVEGRSLEDYLAEGPLPVRRAAEIALDISRALSFCHTYGVVHRGARPDLILVEDDTGRALLTSIGRAPEVADEGGGPTTLVSKGLLFSTLFYFAPEQIDYTKGTIDGQTDIYVLGITIYELITGRRPFTGPSPRAVLAAIMSGEPRSPQSLNHQVDADLAAICLKAMSLNKYHRYITATELQQDLQRWLDGQPVHAQIPSPLFSIVRRLSRRVSIQLRRIASLLLRRLKSLLPKGYGKDQELKDDELTDSEYRDT